MGLYQTITTLALLPAFIAGCATGGISVQERKAVELDALLRNSEISETLVEEPAKIEVSKPEYAHKEKNQEIDLSQYFTSPEDEDKKNSEQLERNILEAKKIMEERYATCVAKLTSRLPSEATGECNGTDRSEYLTCNFKIEGQDYGIQILASDVQKGGFEAAYRKLIGLNPELLKVMADKYCQTKEMEINIESDVVLGFK